VARSKVTRTKASRSVRVKRRAAVENGRKRRLLRFVAVYLLRGRQIKTKEISRACIKAIDVDETRAADDKHSRLVDDLIESEYHSYREPYGNIRGTFRYRTTLTVESVHDG